MKHTYTDAVVAALVYGAMIAAVLFGTYLASAVKCSNVADIMGIEYVYAPLQGCMVHYRDEWVPLESVRVVSP